MNYYLPFIPDGTLIRFPNSADLYIKTCGRNGIGGVVRVDSGTYIESRDLRCLGFPVDDVEIVAYRGGWNVQLEEES